MPCHAAVTLADLVFFVYLYQRYIYRVDPRRTNEYSTAEDYQPTCERAHVPIAAYHCTGQRRRSRATLCRQMCLLLHCPSTPRPMRRPRSSSSDGPH